MERNALSYFVYRNALSYFVYIVMVLSSNSVALRQLMFNRILQFIAVRALFVSALMTSVGCSWITTVSVDLNGDPIGGGTGKVSGDGRYVAFESSNSNMVVGDTNGFSDIFVRDLKNKTTVRASLGNSGNESNDFSYGVQLSDNGQFVGFVSGATNLVAGDTNAEQDIFLRDLINNTTVRVNVSSSGTQANGPGTNFGISGDGKLVAFSSSATNLVVGDTNGVGDLFLRDIDAGTTDRISVDVNGNQSDGSSGSPALSESGRYVVFASNAANLVAGDSNGMSDVFWRDNDTGEIKRVSVSGAGSEGNGASGAPAVSSDGRYVAFSSSATNLVPSDANGAADIFLHDTVAGTTVRVNLGEFESEANFFTLGLPSVSGDGRFVAFSSLASNLVPDDTNSALDVFVRDVVAGETKRVSLSAVGGESLLGGSTSQISRDGRYVVFRSVSDELVPNDSNGIADIVIRAVSFAQIDSVTPDMLPLDSTTPVTILGAGFVNGLTLGVSGSGKSISNVVVVDENTITADVTVNASAASGARSLSVGIPGTGPGQLTGVTVSCDNCITFF